MDHPSKDSSGTPQHGRGGDSSRLKLRVCSFESRRASEMRSLIERHGGIATVVPSMQEIPRDENQEVFAFADALFAGQIDVVIFMTGVGARGLLEVVQTRYQQDKFLRALDRCIVIVRGPKPTAVLNEWNVHIDAKAREPNTWRELLDVLDSDRSLAGPAIAGKTIAVQEYGQPNRQFYRELDQRGAKVVAVPVYRWALPDNTKPLLEAIQTTIDGGFDVLMFTTANQLNNIVQVAEPPGLRERWFNAANHCVIASIGPTASEALQAAGLPADLQPQHPKMGHLVRETMQNAAGLLAHKK